MSTQLFKNVGAVPYNHSSKHGKIWDWKPGQFALVQPALAEHLSLTPGCFERVDDAAFHAAAAAVHGEIGSSVIVSREGVMQAAAVKTGSYAPATTTQPPVTAAQPGAPLETEKTVVAEPVVDTPPVLVGSGSFEAQIVIAEDVYIALGDAVAGACTDMGASPDEWNGLGQADRDQAIQAWIDRQRQTIADASGLAHDAGRDQEAAPVKKGRFGNR